MTTDGAEIDCGPAIIDAGAGLARESAVGVTDFGLLYRRETGRVAMVQVGDGFGPLLTPQLHSFVSPNACATAEQLPSVSGDEGGTASASGTGSNWFKVHVEETDSSIFSADLSYKVMQRWLKPSSSLGALRGSSASIGPCTLPSAWVRCAVHRSVSLP